jgi:hypothetical protein
MTKKFLQETNFSEDESECFKQDALQNIEKHYPNSPRLKQWKEKYKAWLNEPEGHDSY